MSDSQAKNSQLPASAGEPAACELCERPASQLTRHHLIPRTRHKNRRARRRFDRHDMNHRILRVCRPCHSQIHAALSEKELERHYHTRERLLAHPVIAGFVEWIKDKPADFKPRSASRRR